MIICSIILGFSKDQIVGYDETRFIIEAPGNYTYEQIGQRRVLAVTQGHEKVSVCCLFAATASGKKLNWICLIDRDPSNPILGLVVPDGCIVAYSKKGNIIIIFFILHD